MPASPSSLYATGGGAPPPPLQRLREGGTGPLLRGPAGVGAGAQLIAVVLFSCARHVAARIPMTALLVREAILANGAEPVLCADLDQSTLQASDHNNLLALNFCLAAVYSAHRLSVTFGVRSSDGADSRPDRTSNANLIDIIYSSYINFQGSQSCLRGS